MTQPKPQAALYARVSSDGQVQQQTIASQLDLLGQRIEKDGWQISDPWSFVDEGYSGSTLYRPALERLRDLVDTGVITRLYLLAPDRLARNCGHQILLVEELRGHGVEVIFLEGPQRGDSPEQALLLQVQGVIAEYERAKIVERTRRGRKFAAQQGRLSVFGDAPYGYRYVTKAEGGGEARFDVVAEQAEVMRQVFGWIARERISVREAVRRLAQRKIASPKGKPRWNSSTLGAMLRNRTYCGEAVYGKTRVGPRRVLLRLNKGCPEIPRRTGSTYRTDPQQQYKGGV